MLHGPSILVVDDEPSVCEVLSLYLEKEGYRVTACGDGKVAMRLFDAQPFDFVILDVMLPGVNGWGVCRHVRRYSRVPILMLTAKGAFHDKALGYELGVDDYLVKPFDPREIVFKVRAIHNRIRQESGTSLPPVTLADLCIDPERFRVTAGGRDVALSPKEFALLYLLASSPNRVFTRLELLERVWGYEQCCLTRTVDVHVNHLRRKLRGLTQVSIETVWTVGYKLQAPEGPDRRAVSVQALLT